jgi:hypothetical protein
MLRLGSKSLLLPSLSLLSRKRPPTLALLARLSSARTRHGPAPLTDDLGQGTVVALDVTGDPLAFNKGRAKENEGIWGTGNIGRVALLCMGGACGGRHGRGDSDVGGAITGERVLARGIDNRPG